MTQSIRFGSFGLPLALLVLAATGCKREAAADAAMTSKSAAVDADAETRTAPTEEASA